MCSSPYLRVVLTDASLRSDHELATNTNLEEGCRQQLALQHRSDAMLDEIESTELPLNLGSYVVPNSHHKEPANHGNHATHDYKINHYSSMANFCQPEKFAVPAMVLVAETKFAIPYQQASNDQLASPDSFLDLSSYDVPYLPNRTGATECVPYLPNRRANEIESIELPLNLQSYVVPNSQHKDPANHGNHVTHDYNINRTGATECVPYLPNRRATACDPPTDQHQHIMPDSSNTDDAYQIGEIILNPMFIGLSRNTDGRPDHKTGEINVYRDPPLAPTISFFEKNKRNAKYCLLLVLLAAIAVAVPMSVRSFARGQFSASVNNASNDTTMTPTTFLTTTTSETDHPGTLPPLDLFPP